MLLWPVSFLRTTKLQGHGDGFSAEDSQVTGVVSAWGEKVILCEYGFKAQYVKLEALVVEEEMIEVFGSRVCVRKAHEKLAKRYGVPLLLPPEVTSFSKERGAVLEAESQYERVAFVKKSYGAKRKPHSFIRAILEWREEEK